MFGSLIFSQYISTVLDSYSDYWKDFTFLLKYYFQLKYNLIQTVKILKSYYFSHEFFKKIINKSKIILSVSYQYLKN